MGTKPQTWESKEELPALFTAFHTAPGKKERVFVEADALAGKIFSIWIGT